MAPELWPALLGAAVFIAVFIGGLRRWPWWTPFALSLFMAASTAVLTLLIEGRLVWGAEAPRLAGGVLLYLGVYWAGRGIGRVAGR